MRPLSPSTHIWAFVIACLLIFAGRIGEWDMRRIFPGASDQWLKVYTPYFPGLAKLENHEIFAPQNRGLKKIVFLGASAVDSVGCDGTWTFPDESRQPSRNAHYSCTIASQMNVILHDRGINDWRAFDLARTGAKLTSMLYVYSQIQRLKPEVVIFGDSFPYYKEDNADADALNAAQYAQLDAAFSQAPDRQLWSDYKQVLARHGWQLRGQSGSNPAPSAAHPLTIDVVLQDIFANARNITAISAPPFPPKIASFRSWDVTAPGGRPFVNPDAGFQYFQGFGLINDLQRRQGGKFLYYFSPDFGLRDAKPYVAELDKTFGGYLSAHKIPHMSLAALPLKPNYETYDGEHQTLYGNRVIAAALLHGLDSLGFLKRDIHATSP